MGDNDQLTIDFGDETLNDPNYEQKVQDDGTLADTTPDGAGQQDAAPTGTDNNGAAPSTGGTGEQGAPTEQPKDAGAGTPQGQQPPADGQQQQQQQGRPKQDAQGNLIDGQGNIIAKAGAERRQYERTQAQAQYITRLENELTEARKTNHMAQALNEVPQRLGLDMRETELGLQAIAAFKKNPVETARWMLQETMRLGYDLPTIIGKDANGQLNGGSLDLAAVKSMISEAMQPMVQDRTAQQQQSQANATAQREYDAFVAKHEHATVHEDVLANMLAQDRNVTPEIAYWQLREYAAKHQLDFTKPLREQVVARQQGAQQQPQGNVPPQAQTTVPMPNGAAPPQQDMQQSGNFADADASWDSIVNQSLQEAGAIQ